MDALGSFIIDMSTFTASPYLILVLFAAATFAQENLDTLLSELARNPLTTGEGGDVLHKLERQPSNPRIIPALETAFDKATDKKTKQEVARTLVHIGGPDRYYEYLAGFARAAVASDIPEPTYYDPDGHAVKDQFNPIFESWAKDHGMDIKTALRQAAYEMPFDVMLLAQTRDKRANPIFRDGLNSQISGVVVFSAEGLALLQDASAIPLVVAACEKLKGGTQNLAAGKLAKFMNPVADREMERFVPNEVTRKNYRQEAQQYWTGELRNQAMRYTGKTAK